MAADSLPALPTIPGALLDEHARRGAEVVDRIHHLPPEAIRVFRHTSRTRLLEALANLFLDDRALLFPPQRRHLHPSHVARLGGCTAVFEYIDARLEMHRRGHLPDLVGPETPHVINAFAESHDRSDSVTNPGLVRLTDSGFDITQSMFKPPSGSRCAELLDGCVQVANRAPVPAIVRAGWMCAALLAVHPFVDGNGRTARSLFQLVVSSDPATRFDWGTVEQWAIGRRSYVEALKASQAPSMPEYDGDRVDTAPFVLHSIRTALAGLDLVERRALWFGTAWDHLEGDHESDRLVELSVVSRGSSTIGELTEVVDDPVCTEAVNRSVAAGRLTWDRRGLLRPGPVSSVAGLGG